MEAIAFYLLIEQKCINWKQKIKKKTYSLYLGNISKGFTIDNIKKTALKETVKGFSVDYDPISTSNILDIHRNLMKKT